jgi:hypothetical protein
VRRTNLAVYFRERNAVHWAMRHAVSSARLLWVVASPHSTLLFRNIFVVELIFDFVVCRETCHPR